MRGGGREHSELVGVQVDGLSYAALWYGVWCGMVWCSAVLCCMLWYRMVSGLVVVFKKGGGVASSPPPRFPPTALAYGPAPLPYHNRNILALQSDFTAARIRVIRIRCYWSVHLLAGPLE